MYIILYICGNYIIYNTIYIYIHTHYILHIIYTHYILHIHMYMQIYSVYVSPGEITLEAAYLRASVLIAIY